MSVTPLVTRRRRDADAPAPIALPVAGRTPRVLFFTFGFPPDYSGATLQTIELAKALRARGVVASFLSETYRPDLPPETTQDGFVVRRLVRTSDASNHAFGAKLARAIHARRRDFDVLWFTGNPGEFWTTAYATAAARALGKRVLVELNMEFYDGDPLRIRGTRFESLKAWLGRKVERYLPNSTAILRTFPADLVGPRAELLPYGVDLARFRPVSSEEERQALRVRLDLPADRKIVVAVGAVTQRKNPDFVLRAWERVCAARIFGPSPLLVWVGPAMTAAREHHDAAWVQALVASTARGPLAGNVRFAGHQDRPEDWLRAADAFAFASRQEGSPSVVREALACGLPVVALELPGITDELLSDGQDGFLVPTADRASFREWARGPYEDETALALFAARLQHLIADPELATRIGRAARETCARRYSIEARADRVLATLANAPANPEETP